MTMDEADALIRRAVAGDEDALTKLLERHSPEILVAATIPGSRRT